MNNNTDCRIIISATHPRLLADSCGSLLLFSIFNILFFIRSNLLFYSDKVLVVWIETNCTPEKTGATSATPYFLGCLYAHLVLLHFSYFLLSKILLTAKKIRRNIFFFHAHLMKCSVGLSYHFLHFCLSTPVHIYDFIFSHHKDIFVACLIKFSTTKTY